MKSKIPSFNLDGIFFICLQITPKYTKLFGMCKFYYVSDFQCFMVVAIGIYTKCEVVDLYKMRN